MSALSLKHYDKFKQVLNDYKMSVRAQSVLQGLSFVLLVAPTSTGRNTVIKELIDSKNYYFVVSDTTRPPQVRDGKLEENGLQYFFRTEAEMLADLKAGEFLEAAIIHEQQVSGISVRELERAKLLNKTAITDIEVVGTDNVMKATKSAKAIFLIPPSFEQWQERIMSRGNMEAQMYKNRLTSAQKEFQAALEYDYYHYVITENVEHSAQLIDDIVHNQPNPHQERGRKLIETIQEELATKLQTLG